MSKGSGNRESWGDQCSFANRIEQGAMKMHPDVTGNDEEEERKMVREKSESEDEKICETLLLHHWRSLPWLLRRFHRYVDEHERRFEIPASPRLL